MVLMVLQYLQIIKFFKIKVSMLGLHESFLSCQLKCMGSFSFPACFHSWESVLKLCKKCNVYAFLSEGKDLLVFNVQSDV